MWWREHDIINTSLTPPTLTDATHSATSPNLSKNNETFTFSQQTFWWGDISQSETCSRSECKVFLHLIFHIVEWCKLCKAILMCNVSHCFISRVLTHINPLMSVFTLRSHRNIKELTLVIVVHSLFSNGESLATLTKSLQTAIMILMKIKIMTMIKTILISLTMWNILILDDYVTIINKVLIRLSLYIY